MKKVALTLAIAFASYFTVNAQTNSSVGTSNQQETTQDTLNSNTEQNSDLNQQDSELNQQDTLNVGSDTQGQGMGSESDVEMGTSSSSAELEALPEAVKNAFMTGEHSDLEVTKVENEGNNYIIKGKKGEKDVKLEYDAEGNLIDKTKKHDDK